jgi:hypothetical protein
MRKKKERREEEKTEGRKIKRKKNPLAYFGGNSHNSALGDFLSLVGIRADGQV